jgi:hypothetical protein
MGKVHLLDFVDPYGVSEEDKAKKKATIAVKQVLEAKVITLLPCFDFFNITLRPVPILGEDGKPQMIRPGIPEMGMQRDPMVNTPDFLVYDAPVHVTSRMAAYFFSQMDERDVAAYRSFMKQALLQRDRYRQQTSAIQPPSDAERKAIERGHAPRS